ncbi:MAG: 30S ribosomal protein S12 methylthiotransferase RimO [Treponema sp.]|nr:30S ribosomal protein S12 methylthiotransferase RimO [Treponema sp.]
MRYFLDPFGCAKNQVDAELMMSHLNNAGWEAAPDAAGADLIIVNSCGFIESAKMESINAVLGWSKMYPGKKILLAGCLAQRYAKDLALSLPEADAFLGVEDISRIINVAEDLTQRREGSAKDAEESGGCGSGDMGNRPLLSLPGSAYVKISEGCDNRCSYCAIPLIRGGLVCRTVPDIVSECDALLKRGITELCIIGQDICAYHSNGSGLPELLESISLLPGNFWVRLLYMHPDHFPMRVLDIIERDARFLPYFDIPFQHASEKILKAMNRKGTADEYLALVENIRRRLPDAVIRSTFLLGFPGETEKDFLALCEFQNKIKLDWLGCFAYSREDDTPAWSMPAQVPGRVAERRKRIIEEVQIPITTRSMDRFIGKSYDVLVEEQPSSPDSLLLNEALPRSHSLLPTPHSPHIGHMYFQAPEVDGAIIITSGGENLRPGDIVRCKVIARRGFDLEVVPDKCNSR